MFKYFDLSNANLRCVCVTVGWAVNKFYILRSTLNLYQVKKKSDLFGFNIWIFFYILTVQSSSFSGGHFGLKGTTNIFIPLNLSKHCHLLKVLGATIIHIKSWMAHKQLAWWKSCICNQRKEASKLLKKLTTSVSR